MADLKGKLDQMDQDMVGIAYERLIPVTARFREQIIEKGGAEDDVEQALVDLDPGDPASVMAFLVKVHADANECPCRRHALQAFNTAGFGVFLEKVVREGDFNEKQLGLVSEALVSLFIGLDNTFSGALSELEDRLKEAAALMKIVSVMGGGPGAMMGGGSKDDDGSQVTVLGGNEVGGPAGLMQALMGAMDEE